MEWPLPLLSEWTDYIHHVTPEINATPLPFGTEKNEQMLGARTGGAQREFRTSSLAIRQTLWHARQRLRCARLGCSRVATTIAGPSALPPMHVTGRSAGKDSEAGGQ